MITCRELAELLHDFLDGELPSDHRQRIQAHLDHCQHCVYLVESYQLTIDLSRRLPRSELPCSCTDRLHAALSNYCQQDGLQ